MQELLRRAWDTLDTFKQAYPENWHDDDEQVLKDLMRADSKLSGTKLKWHGLTAKERTDLWWSIDMNGQPEHVYGKAIEAKLKEKNHV